MDYLSEKIIKRQHYRIDYGYPFDSNVFDKYPFVSKLLIRIDIDTLNSINPTRLW